MRPQASWLLGSLAACAPRLCAACPNCMGSQRSAATLGLVGVLMLVPFAAVGVVTALIVRASRRS